MVASLRNSEENVSSRYTQEDDFNGVCFPSAAVSDGVIFGNFAVSLDTKEHKNWTLWFIY